MNKLRNKIIDKRIIEKILMFFLILQPILDLYFLFDEKVVSMFGFSPSTIIRIAFVFVIAVLFLIVWRNKKELILYIIYAVFLVVYIVFHHINALNFTNFYSGYDFGYNLVGELFYIIRMLLPLITIIISFHYEFDNKSIEKIVNWLLFIICGSIIVSNLFVISTGSYSKEIIKGNIFCWFQADRCNLNYLDLASKGFFLDPNRLSALLILLSTIMIYNFINNSSFKNMFIFFITLIGMLMLGTKVSTYGFFAICIIALFFYLFFAFIKKEIKFSKRTFGFIAFIIALSLLITPKAPAVNRTNIDVEAANSYNNDVDGIKTKNEAELEKVNNNIKEKYKKTHSDAKEEKSIDEILKELDSEERNELLINFVRDNYLSYGLHGFFVEESYPYHYDPEFWYNVMKMDYYDRVNFRKIEYLMLTRVKELNNNKYDDLLGITFVREGNIFDLERDYISQYITMGLFGFILLVLPYIIIVAVCILKMIISFRKSFALKNVFYLLGVGICLSAAYFTGNVLDGLIVTIMLGFFIGQLINGTFGLGNMIKKS